MHCGLQQLAQMCIIKVVYDVLSEARSNPAIGAINRPNCSNAGWQSSDRENRKNYVPQHQSECINQLMNNE